MMGNQTVSSGTPFAAADGMTVTFVTAGWIYERIVNVLNGDSNFVDNSEMKASKYNISDKCLRNT